MLRFGLVRVRLLVCGGAAALAVVFGTANSALACAGLIGSNGAVNLGRTTTLAAYHDGIEHYVTAFKFLGGGGQFGTLIPLPAVPTSVERGGAWTLQRLVRETQPPRPTALAAARAGVASPTAAEVVLQARVDALDLTVLKGGGPAVADWAHQHGFSLSPDAPEVLDFYAQHSPVFLAAVFDGEAAQQRGQKIGDGTPVHLTIPVPNPWVPLRILGLGKQAADQVDADVFLLTDEKPALLPAPGPGFALAHSAVATTKLLDDLRGDAGMGWVPHSAWLTELAVNSKVSDLKYDLSIDATRAGAASGVAPTTSPARASTETPPVLPYIAALLVLCLPWLGLVVLLRRPGALPAIRARATGGKAHK